MLYVLLCRYQTRAHYPGVSDLTGALKASPRRVVQLLGELRGRGLLNEYDLEVILATEGENDPGRSREED